MASMGGPLRRLNSSEVSHSAASVLGRVAIQQLSPESSRGNSQSVVQPWHRRKITLHHNPALQRLSFAQKGDRVGLAVVAVDPLKTHRIVIELVES